MSLHTETQRTHSVKKQLFLSLFCLLQKNVAKIFVGMEINSYLCNIFYAEGAFLRHRERKAKVMA